MEKKKSIKGIWSTIQSKLALERVNAEKRKQVKTILLVLIILHVIVFMVSFFTPLLSFSSLAREIIASLVGIANIVAVFWIIKLAQNEEKQKPNQDQNQKSLLPTYDPILLHFLLTNKISVTEPILLAELLDLVKRGYVTAEGQNSEKPDIHFELKKEQSFKRLGSLMKIEPEQMETYATAEIPCYENAYVMKILFPNGKKLTWQEIKRNLTTSFYQDRLQLCQYPLEKMLVHELEKRKLIEKSGRDKWYLGLLLINILMAIFCLFSAGSFNPLLILGILFNLVISAWCLKEEKILNYELSESTEQEVKQIQRLVKSKQKGEEVSGEEVIYEIVISEQVDSSLVMEYIGSHGFEE